tara:strand:+ start:67 stop:1164 length:1098 start_codon:yes stop_codon:yes gene_type:complete
MNNLIIHKDKVYKPIESPFYNGYEPVDVDEDEPTLEWKGGKIPIAVWNQVLSFFKWSYDETHSETQVRLLYHPKDNHWVAWAFPQEHGTGMTAKEIDGDEKDKQRARFAGYTACGTVHHHCSSGAFQSSVDHNNEISQDGVHITVGNMDKNMYDIHARVCRKGVMYGCDYSQWFEYPKEWDGILPKRFISPALEEKLITPPSESSFPEEWKENLIKVERRPVHSTYKPRSNYGYQTNHYAGAGFRKTYNQPCSVPVQSNLSLPAEYTLEEKKEAMRKVIDVVTDEKQDCYLSIDELSQCYIYAIVPDIIEGLFELIKEYGIKEEEFTEIIDEIDNERLDQKEMELDQKYAKDEPLDQSPYVHDYY